MLVGDSLLGVTGVGAVVFATVTSFSPCPPLLQCQQVVGRRHNNTRSTDIIQGVQMSSDGFEMQMSSDGFAHVGPPA